MTVAEQKKAAKGVLNIGKISNKIQSWNTNYIYVFIRDNGGNFRIGLMEVKKQIWKS